MPPESQNQDAKLIQGEQKRLDLLDAKKDKKVEVGGKDFGKIIFEKTDELTKKINDDFGARDVRLINSKEFQALKKKGMNAIVTVLWSIDKKNIEVESGRLEAVITTLEKSGESMRKLEAYLQNGDAMTDKMKDVDGNLEPLLKKIEEMRRKDDSETTFFGQKIHKGDMIELRPDGYNKPIKQILIVNIDTEGKTIRIQEVGSMTMQRRSYEDVANYVMALKGGYTRQFKGEEIHVGIRKRMVVEKTTNGELLQQEELAKQYLQEKAILAWEQRILDKNVGVNFDEGIKNNPACSSFFGTSQFQLKDGKLAFSVEFSKKNTDTVHGRRMEALKALELYLDKKPLVEKEKKAISEKDEGAKYIAQAELALQEGRLADARRSAISYIHFQKQHPENFIRTPREEEKIQKINIYLEKIQELAIQKLRAANNATFGKSAYEAMKRRKVYSGDMRIYESAFSNVHARNAKILEQMTASKNETDLIRDPEEIFRTAQTAADPMHTPELREAIKNCERIWNKVAYAETRFMTKNPKGEEKTAYADAAEALRTLGETSNAEGYLIAGMQDKIDIIKNADVGKKLKDTIILKLNAHREEYVKQVKSQFLRDHAWEEDAEIPEEIFNLLVDSAIERAADGELEKKIMKDIDFANDTGKLDASADKRLAALHDRMLNPNDKFFAITDEELYDTGDKVIGLAGEALVIGLSGGVGGIASAGTRALLMRIGARKLLAHAGAVVVEAGAFELANKTIAPHITGGPGFTTGQEFMQDWGRSIIMFGALKGGGAYAQQLKTLHVNQLAKTGKVLSKTAEFGHNAFALATEASAMTFSTEVQEIASGKSISEIDSLRLAADNLKMILELRLGGKLVAPITKPLHEYAADIERRTQQEEWNRNHPPEKAPASDAVQHPEKIFDFSKPEVENPEIHTQALPEETSIETPAEKTSRSIDKMLIHEQGRLERQIREEKTFRNLYTDESLDPELQRRIEARKEGRKNDLIQIREALKCLDDAKDVPKNVETGSPENIKSLVDTIGLLREEIDLGLPPSVGDMWNTIWQSNLTLEQKKMALGTVTNMLSVVYATQIKVDLVRIEALRRLKVEPGKRYQGEVTDVESMQQQVMAEMLAEKMKLPPLKEKVQFKMEQGILVLRCENDEDFAAITNNNVGHLPSGEAFTPEQTGMGISMIVIKSDQPLTGKNSVVRHEIQHIFKQGSNNLEPGRIMSDNYQNVQIADEHGQIDAGKIEAYFKKEHGNIETLFKDEVLAFLRTESRNMEVVIFRLHGEEGRAYDYWNGNREYMLHDIAGEHPELLNDPKFVESVDRMIQDQRTKYRDQTKRWLNKIHENVISLQGQGMSEMEARDRLADTLMFKPVREWETSPARALENLIGKEGSNPELKIETDRHAEYIEKLSRQYIAYDTEFFQQKGNTEAKISHEERIQIVQSLQGRLRSNTTTLDEIYNETKDSHLTKEEKRMVLATALHMLGTRNHTGNAIAMLKMEASRRGNTSPENVLAELIAERLGLSPFEGGINYKEIAGVFVMQCRNDADYKRILEFVGIAHTTYGVAFRSESLGLGMSTILIGPQGTLSESDGTVAHEIQHIMKEGSNNFEPRIRSENAMITVRNENGKFDISDAEAWIGNYFEPYKVQFKDEILAFFVTNDMPLDAIMDSLFGGNYDYLDSAESRGFIDAKIEQLLRENYHGSDIAGARADLHQAGEQARKKYRSDTITMFSEAEITAFVLMESGMSETAAREHIRDTLMFTPIEKWPAHLEEVRKNAQKKYNTPPPIPVILRDISLKDVHTPEAIRKITDLMKERGVLEEEMLKTRRDGNRLREARALDPQLEIIMRDYEEAIQAGDFEIFNRRHDKAKMDLSWEYPFMDSGLRNLELELRIAQIDKRIITERKIDNDPHFLEILLKGKGINPHQEAFITSSPSPEDTLKIIEICNTMAEKLRASGLSDAAEDIKDMNLRFALVDGSPMRTIEQRVTFYNKMQSLTPLEHQWYATRPSRKSDPDTLKAFTEQFVRDNVIPKIIERNLTFESIVIELHNWLMRGSGAQLETLSNKIAYAKDIVGKYRDRLINVGKYIPPGPKNIPTMMDALSRQIDSFSTQLENRKSNMTPSTYEDAAIQLGLYAQQQFVGIHPMDDGNGRTSRALYEYIVKKHLGNNSPLAVLPGGKYENDEGQTIHSELGTFNETIAKKYQSSSLTMEGEKVLMDDLTNTTLDQVLNDPIYIQFKDAAKRLILHKP